MPLKGETLKGYNNLPAIPIEQPLGDLLNTIPVGDPALENPTGTVTLYVDASGSDDTGDGSQANPYATPQMALDAIPATAAEGAEYRIQCGAGIFPFPSLDRLPPQALIQIIGDRSNPTVSIPAGTGAFTQDAGKEVRWTGTSVGYTDTITDGSHWRLAISPSSGSLIGGLVTASVSPSVSIIQSFNVTNSRNIEVHPYATFFEVPDSSAVVNYGPRESSEAQRYSSNVRLVGIAIRNSGPSFEIFFGVSLNFYGCKIYKEPTASGLNIELERCTGSVYIEEFFTSVSCQFSNAYFKSAFWTIEGVGFNTADSCILGTQVVVNSGGSLRVIESDLEGTGAGTALGLFGSSPKLQVSNITVSGYTALVTTSGSRLAGLGFGGTVSGSVTGNAITLSNGAHATGIEGACNGNLTAGGSEIIVGGNLGQTFASLPATDLGAGSPQLCRAT